MTPPRSNFLKTSAVILIAIALIGTETRKTGAQEQNAQTAPASEKTAKQATSDQRPASADEKAPEAITEVQRLHRLEQVIKLDKGKLAETKKQLAEQEAFYDDLNAGLEAAVPRLAGMKQQLEQMGGAEASDEATVLATEIEALEQRITLGKSELEVRFNTVKTLRGQIQALEQKIANEQQALETLISPAAPAPAVTPEQAPAATAGTQPGPAPSPAQIIAPGVSTGEPAPVQPRQQIEPETAEQIEARREAEKLEEEAKLAEQELVGFVERKRNLEQQIELEQALLATAETSRRNLDSALNLGRSELDELIAQNAGKGKLQDAKRRIDEIQALVEQNRQEIDRRRDYIESLYQRREELSAEQLAVTQQLEAKREEAGAARKRSVWLQSPLHPRNVWNWMVERGPRILIVLFVAWILLLLIRFASPRIARAMVVRRGDSDRRGGTNRANTLALSFQSGATVFIVVAGTLLAFQEAGVDIKTVLGGAAILGVAFAFGAQNLMRDFFTGVMIILEDQYELGDLVTIGPVTGTVEKVNMRTTVLRDFEGRVHFIPNGEIKSVTNRTYVWGRALLRIPVALKEDPDRVIEVIREVEEEFRADPEVGDWVTDEPVVLGVDKFSEYGMVIVTYMKTRPDTVFQTRRELLRRIKKRFDKEGIEISVPHLKLLQSEGG